MTGLVSGNYRKLDREEAARVAVECDAAWQDVAIPMRQWVSVVRGEIDRYRNGHHYPHFEGLIRALKITDLVNPTVLDVGASSAFYNEILAIGGFDCRYTAADYSEAYKKLAGELYPDVPFKVADARYLPFDGGSFDIVLSGCCMLHIYDYPAVIREAARVASKFVVFNRTPVTVDTTFYEKSAYGARCLEIHFGEEELLRLFNENGLEVVLQQDVYSDPENHYAHRTYLTRKR